MAELSQVVGEHSVSLLFRLVAVERTQPCIHVHHLDLGLGGGQGSDKGRVGIVLHQHRIGPLSQQHPLDRHQYSAGVNPVAAPADTQVKGRRGDSQLQEELNTHRRIEMLTGVQDALHNRAIAALGGCNSAAKGFCLDELGPRA